MTDPTFRQIRVFISSTFRDMAAERDYLVKFVFPQLRRLCESRGVVWGEVDLRWGITDEQSAEGQVLPLCLAEIQRCRPYFIGLLGERYGWIPEAIDPELIAQEPWLSEHLERSVTELEILHGVLKDPEMADKALFYFRDPAYLETLDEDQLENYIEVPWREDIERYGMAEAQRRVTERQAKLAALKDRIRESGLPLKENYRDPQELGAWVLADLTAIINDLFPKGSQPDPLAQEGMLHEAFARERARVYIGGEKYYTQLDEHMAASRQPVVVMGESGSGKSALLSNWGLKRGAENTDELVLMHFLGASVGSTDLANMLARIMAELKEHCEIPQDLPQTENELRQAFPNWLYMAAANREFVLILDGLNQLEEGAQELDWLPLELPENAGLVLSALPGRALDVINARDWSSLIVVPLTEGERVQLVQDYLAQYSKQLSPERVARIIADPQSENPLGLRVLLEELRQFGVHEQLDEVIDRYLAADSISEMYRLVLERCEADYEGERPGLVRDALSCIWAARRGLSEVELLELLGEGSEPLPHRLWSPLYLALEGGLVDRGGLLDFFHDYLSQAVAERYLHGEEEKTRAHVRLADYFGSMSLMLDVDRTLKPNLRKLSELVYQQFRGGLTNAVKKTLMDYRFLRAKLNGQGIFELISDFDIVLDTFPVNQNWEPINIIRKTLGISSYRLKEYPLSLPGQLLGRLLENNNYLIKKLIFDVQQNEKSPWLRPLYKCLAAPDEDLMSTLNGYEAEEIIISVDCKYVIINSINNTIKVLELSTGKCVHTLSGHKKKIEEIILNKDETRIISLSNDNSIKVWDFNYGVCLKTLLPRSNWGLVRLIPGGDNLIILTTDNKLIVWDIDNNNEILTFEEKIKQAIKNMIITNSKRLITVMMDNSIRVWNIITGKYIYLIHASDCFIEEINVTSDGLRAVTVIKYGNSKKIISIWNLETGISILTLKNEYLKLLSFENTAAGYTVLFSDESHIIVFNIDSGKYFKFRSNENRAIIIPGENEFVTWVVSRSAHLRDIETAKLKQSFGHSRTLNTRLVISNTGTCAVFGNWKGDLTFWRLDQNISINDSQQSHKHMNSVDILAMSHDGSYFLSGSKDIIKMWDSEKNICIKTFPADFFSLKNIRITFDNEKCVFMSYRRINIIDIVSEQKHILNIPRDDPKYTLTVNGKELLYESKKGEIILLDLISGKIKHSIETPDWVVDMFIFPESDIIITLFPNNLIYSLRVLENEILIVKTFEDRFFSDAINSSLLFSSKSKACIIKKPGSIHVEVLGGEKRYTGIREMSNANITAMALSPEGNKFAFGTITGFLGIQDIYTETVISSFYAGTTIKSIIFFPDGLKLVAGDDNGQLYFLMMENHSFSQT